MSWGGNRHLQSWCARWRDRELKPAFLWTKRSTLGKSPIPAVSGALIKQSPLSFVPCAHCQGEANGEKVPGRKTSFGLLEKGCNLSSYTVTNVSYVINGISCHEWLCHYDCDDYIVIMQGLRLQIRAGASSSSGPVKLREQINSVRISLAGLWIGGGFTRMNTHKGIISLLNFHFLFATGAPATVLPLPTCILLYFSLHHHLAQLTKMLYCQWVLSMFCTVSRGFSPVNPDIPFSTIFLCILKAPSSLENKSSVCYSQVPENPWRLTALLRAELPVL